MEITNLGKADGLPPVDWAAVAGKLDAGSAPAPDAANSRTTWLSTVNEDGSPHVTAVGALWLDGTFWFQTGAGTRKGRNVARDPRCSIAVSIRDADVVIEGDAARVTEPGAVEGLPRPKTDWGTRPGHNDPGVGRDALRVDQVLIDPQLAGPDAGLAGRPMAGEPDGTAGQAASPPARRDPVDHLHDAL